MQLNNGGQAVITPGGQLIRAAVPSILQGATAVQQQQQQQQLAAAAAAGQQQQQQAAAAAAAAASIRTSTAAVTQQQQLQQQQNAAAVAAANQFGSQVSSISINVCLYYFFFMPDCFTSDVTTSVVAIKCAFHRKLHCLWIC